MSENIESISNQQNPEKKKGRWSSIVAMAIALIVDNTEDSIVNSLFPAIRNALNLCKCIGSVLKYRAFHHSDFWSIMGNGCG